MMQDRERTIYELSTLVSAASKPETGVVRQSDMHDGALSTLEETAALGEVTQLQHNDSSSIFDASEVVAAGDKNRAVEDSEVALVRLQREVAVLRGKLVAQVKANTRLKTAYNALAHSTVRVPVNISQSINTSIMGKLTHSGVLQFCGSAVSMNVDLACFALHYYCRGGSSEFFSFEPDDRNEWGWW